MENILNIRFIYENSNYDIKIQPEESLYKLKQKIKEELERKNIVKDISLQDISLKMGFPPKTIEGSSEDNKNMKEMRISNNEQLRIEIKAMTQNYNQSNKTGNSEQIDFSKFSIQRKIIPADNSCLFNSINYAINQISNEPEIMRELIANEILTHKDIYNSAILEKDPDKYSEWIMRNDTWGGGIELSILSKLLSIKLAVSDIKNRTIENFGESYPNVIYLIYDGIHYDVFVKRDNNGTETGVFSSCDETIENQVKAIIEAYNKMSLFTDTQNFSIKCNVCYNCFKGNDEAVTHSKSTGHINFVQL